jgi:hypothetical protein
MGGREMGLFDKLSGKKADTQLTMFTDEQFGTFTFDMRARIFETEIAYSHDFINISLEHTEDIETLRRIYENFAAFLSDAAAYAADQLMDFANECGHDTWDEEVEGEKHTPLTRKDFIGLLTLTGIDVAGNGRYSLWYNDGGIFGGHLIRLDGSLSEGFTDAGING